MTGRRFFRIFAVIPLTIAFAISAQQPGSSSEQRSMRLNVVVAGKSGIPVTGLSQQDFTVLDNMDPRPITSFRLVTRAQEPVRLIIVLDEVNASYMNAEMQRDGVNRFLRANGGELEFPVSLALFTDSGTRIQPSFSTDGNALAKALAQETLSQRDISRGTAFGDYDRVRMSLIALHKIAGAASALPDRKIILWISPGWPLLSSARFRIDAQIQSQLFDEVVALSTQLRQANVTLYDINTAAVGQMRETAYYEGFLKGVSKPGQAMVGNVALQVLAMQSGGNVEQSNADANPMIQNCLRDVGAWYEIGFDAPPSDAPDVYHHIDIRVDKEHVNVRTRDGYYANPTPDPQR